MATVQELKSLKAKEVNFELLGVVISLVGLFVAYSRYRVKKQQIQ